MAKEMLKGTIKSVQINKQKVSTLRSSRSRKERRSPMNLRPPTLREKKLDPATGARNQGISRKIASHGSGSRLLREERSLTQQNALKKMSFLRL